tara:strand:+ start:495 stop:1016 length:522 start_codon:yes stop_codon:yes gene_type:complete
MTCPKVFILDVDGVMTDGKFYYSNKGKVMKVFGADDNDALSLLKEYINIRFITGDKKGFSISKKRIDDMGFELNLVSTIKRVDWIKDKYKLSEVIYMGDGIFDHYVMQKVRYSISTSNSDINAKKFSNYITKRNGSERAVAEACLHIMKNFFKPFNPNKPLKSKSKMSGNWGT